MAASNSETGWQRGTAKEKVLNPWQGRKQKEKGGGGDKNIPFRVTPTGNNPNQAPPPNSTFSY